MGVHGRWVVAAAGAVLTAGAWAGVAGAAQPARSSASTGWRVVKTFGCGGIVDSVTALSARTAWTTGRVFVCNSVKEDLLVARWNGRSWTRVASPSAFNNSNSTGEAITALSASYSWTFLQQGGQSLALLYQSGHWRTFRLADDPEFVSAMAFSRSNVWAFGITQSGGGAAYAIHFNGRSWRRVTLPVLPTGAAFSGPRDIWVSWASGLAHWTGKWHVIPFPKHLRNTSAPLPNSVVSGGTNGAWVTASSAGLLLHWTGRAWVKFNAPSGLSPGVLAHDGSGGFWMTAVNNPTCNPQGICVYDMVRYSPAHGWSKPVSIGGTMVTSIRLITGTRSLWASANGAVILKFGS